MLLCNQRDTTRWKCSSQELQGLLPYQFACRTAVMSWHNTAHPTGRLDQTVLEAWHDLQVHTASSKIQVPRPHCFYCFVFKAFNPSGYKEYFQSMESVYSPANLGRAQTTLPGGEKSMEKGPRSQSLYEGSKKAGETTLQRSEHPVISKFVSNTKLCGGVKTLEGRNKASRERSGEA